MRSTLTKQKHLTLSDRNDIQLGLERGETFKAIGQSILKDPTTVSKEVKRNRQVRESTCDNLPCPQQYEQTLVEAREGTPLNSQTFWDSEKDTYLSLLLT